MFSFFFCNYYYNIVIFLFFDKILLTNDKINAILKKKPLFSNRGINMQRKNRSLKLSIAFTTFFTISLAFRTVSAPWSVGIICKIFKHEHLTDFLIFMTYLAIPAGWGALVLLYKILFNDHLYTSLWDSQINIVHNSIVVPLVNLLLLVVFCRMKNLIPLTRIIGILACLIPIIYHMATLFGINVYTPMLGQTFIITNGLLWCTMLLLLYMNTKTQN